MPAEGIPPPGVDPGRLFLDLSEWPHVSRPIGFRFSVAPEVALLARPVPSRVFAAAAARRDASAIVAASVIDDRGAPVFSSAAEVGRIVDAGELAALVHDVLGVIDSVGPTFGRCDFSRWQQVLAQGAQDVPSVAYAMAQCFDVAVGWGGVSQKPRPDRYYGAPMRDLLDGHMMAFRAGYESFNRDR